jgi:ABC-type nitrate/sulfonate/bicarbonate transport system permease component
MYALIIVTGLLGWLVNALFTRLERRVLHWHPSQRRAAEGAPA